MHLLPYKASTQQIPIPDSCLDTFSNVNYIYFYSLAKSQRALTLLDYPIFLLPAHEKAERRPKPGAGGTK